MQTLLDSLGPAQALTAYQILLSLCVAFLAGTFLAMIYRRTHTGFSYSRSFLQAMVLASIVAAIMIIAIGNNLARGLGILGALALIRFRTPVRDPRDIIFLFAALAVGIASGAQVFGVCILGSGFFGLTALYLNWSPYTSRREFEGLLRFLAPAGEHVEGPLREVLERYASSSVLVSLRQSVQGEVMEYAYQVRLRDPTYKMELITSLQARPEISEVNMVMQRSTVEI